MKKTDQQAHRRVLLFFFFAYMSLASLLDLIVDNDSWTPLQTNPTPAQVRDFSTHNKSFRRVLFTSAEPPRVPQGTAVQTVLMAITDYVGWEQHDSNTQHFLVISGVGKAYRGQTADKAAADVFPLSAGDSFFVLPLQWHDVENTSTDGTQLKLVSLYYPPHHPPNRHQRTRQIAEAEEAAENKK